MFDLSFDPVADAAAVIALVVTLIERRKAEAEASKKGVITFIRE